MALHTHIFRCPCSSCTCASIKVLQKIPIVGSIDAIFNWTSLGSSQQQWTYSPMLTPCPQFMWNEQHLEHNHCEERCVEHCQWLHNFFYVEILLLWGALSLCVKHDPGYLFSSMWIVKEWAWPWFHNSIRTSATLSWLRALLPKRTSSLLLSLISMSRFSINIITFTTPGSKDNIWKLC